MSALVKPEPIIDTAITPLSILQTAVEKGASIETVERLVKLQREMMEYDAKLAFDNAMQKAQQQMRRIGVDANNPQTHSKYATYAKIDGAIRPIYTAEGFSLSFDTAEAPNPDIVRLVCYVSHSGYTRTYKLDMPADGKGAKGGDVMTKTHATGAALTYGKRYLLNMIFNLAIGETDDDGNGAGSISDQVFADLLDGIEGAYDENELRKAFGAAYIAAEKEKDQDSMRQFVNAKDKRKKELRESR